MSGSPEAAMKAQMAAPWAELAAIVGSDHLRAATPADAVDGVPAQMVIQPASADELARALRVANAAGLSVIPRGGGTKLGWGNPPRRADLILSTARLDRVLEHAWGDMICRNWPRVRSGPLALSPRPCSGSIRSRAMFAA